MKTLLALTVILGGVLFTQKSFAVVTGDQTVKVAPGAYPESHSSLGCKNRNDGSLFNNTKATGNEMSVRKTVKTKG